MVSFCHSQQIFLLEKPGTVNNKKYYSGDAIKIKTIHPDTILSGKITGINDSSIIVGYANEVFIGNINYIVRGRWGFSLLQKVFLSAGFAYVVIATFNGLINNDKPIVDEQTLIISGSLLVAGVILTPITTRKHKIDSKHWRVKILDFSK